MNAEADAAAIVVSEEVTPSMPPLPEPPAGVPALLADTPEIRKLLGGPPRPAPMRVGRVKPAGTAAAPTVEPVVAGRFSGTFSGAAVDADLKGKVAAARGALAKIITAIQEGEVMLPGLLEAIAGKAEVARVAEGFDVSEAAEFYQAVAAALDGIRESAE